LLTVPFGAGEDEWVIDTGGASTATRAARRIRVDGAQSVGVGRKGEFVDEGRRKRADDAEGSGAVVNRPYGELLRGFLFHYYPLGPPTATNAAGPNPALHCRLGSPPPQPLNSADLTQSPHRSTPAG